MTEGLMVDVAVIGAGMAGLSAGAVLHAGRQVVKQRGGRVVCIFSGMQVYE